ncbi:MAG: hypothetical protein M1608_14400 [Candidatus Omnitrophica bacterium]|nr:hypothetical protein [Candidatus Omnitrophota bacterium]
MSEPWLIFWIITIVVSNVLFLGVTIVVAVKGWADLRDLRHELRQGGNEPSAPNDPSHA